MMIMGFVQEEDKLFGFFIIHIIYMYVRINS